jgi:hypothetical protein
MADDESRGKRPILFDDPAIDALVKMLMELAREHWVTRARLAALEAKVGSVEDFVLSPDAEAKLAAERDVYVRKVFGALERPLD